MKNLTVFSLWVVLVNESGALAPLTLRATTTTRRQNFAAQVPSSRITTSIYATVEDEKQREKISSSRDDDSVADAFLEKGDLPISHSSKTIFPSIPYSELTIGIVTETFDGENRVSATPDSVTNLIKSGFTVIVQSGGKFSWIYCCDDYVLSGLVVSSLF